MKIVAAFVGVGVGVTGSILAMLLSLSNNYRRELLVYSALVGGVSGLVAAEVDQRVRKQIPKSRVKRAIAAMEGRYSAGTDPLVDSATALVVLGELREVLSGSD